MGFWVAILKGIWDSQAFHFLSGSGGVQCRNMHLWEQPQGRWPCAPHVLRCCPWDVPWVLRSWILDWNARSDIQRTKDSFRLCYQFPPQPWEVLPLPPMSAHLYHGKYINFLSAKEVGIELMSLWNAVWKNQLCRTLSEKGYTVATSQKKSL